MAVLINIENAHPRISYGYTEKGAAKYHRLNCGRYFNEPTKTIFEHHKSRIHPSFCSRWFRGMNMRIKEVAEGNLGEGVKHRSLLSAVIRLFASHSLPPVNSDNLGDLYSIRNSLILFSANFTYSSSMSYPT